MKDEKIEQISDFFKLFADPTRLRILKVLLVNKEMCVNEIAESIGMSHSATSHQLAKLEARDILHCERKGKTMCYMIKENVKTKIFKKIMSIFNY